MLENTASTCGYLLETNGLVCLGIRRLLAVLQQSNGVLKVIFRLLVMVGTSMWNCR